MIKNIINQVIVRIKKRKKKRTAANLELGEVIDNIDADSTASSSLPVNTIKQRWSKMTECRLISTIFLVSSSLLSGLSHSTGRWSHFDGCNLWNDRYPHTPKSKTLLNLLRTLNVMQLSLLLAASIAWFARIRKWNHTVCQVTSTDTARMGTKKANRWFILFILTDFYRALVELLLIFIFFGFFVEAVATPPSSLRRISWLVDLVASGVIGCVPIFAWLLPMAFSFVGVCTLPSVWEEFCKQQTFNRRFSFYYFNHRANQSPTEE